MKFFMVAFLAGLYVSLQLKCYSVADTPDRQAVVFFFNSIILIAVIALILRIKKGAE